MERLQVREDFNPSAQVSRSPSQVNLLPQRSTRGNPGRLRGPSRGLTGGLTSSNTDASSAPSAADILTGLSCVNTARSSACGGFMAGPTLAAIKAELLL